MIHLLFRVHVKFVLSLLANQRCLLSFQFEKFALSLYLSHPPSLQSHTFDEAIGYQMGPVPAYTLASLSPFKHFEVCLIIQELHNF